LYAGTVIALFFGSVFNMMTRTWMLVDMRETKPTVDLKRQEAEAPVQEVNGAATSIDSEVLKRR
jgi:hypothetical protein